MRMGTDQPLPAAGRIGLGLLLLAAGALPVLAAFDMGPLHQSDINGPPWLAIAAGGVFVLAGIAMLLGHSGANPLLSYVLMFVILAAFAAIANWIAFGPGPRRCSAGFTAFLFSSTRAAAEWECRAAFGLGALILNGILICMAAGAPKRFLGPGRATEALDKLGNAALLLGLLPVLLPLLLFGLGSGLLAGLRDYLKTGHWPRNDALIARREREQDGEL